jgi:hypothetical protein
MTFMVYGPKLHVFIGFGDMYGPNLHKSIGLGNVHVW